MEKKYHACFYTVLYSKRNREKCPTKFFIHMFLEDRHDTFTYLYRISQKKEIPIIIIIYFTLFDGLLYHFQNSLERRQQRLDWNCLIQYQIWDHGCNLWNWQPIKRMTILLKKEKIGVSLISATNSFKLKINYLLQP